MTAFWDIVVCILVVVDRQDFSEVLGITLMMEVASTSETSVRFYDSVVSSNP
jgi:hypothetical protein